MFSLIALVVVVAFVVSVASALFVSTRRAASLHDVPSIDLVLDRASRHVVHKSSVV